jgi:hypothetical protein
VSTNATIPNKSLLLFTNNRRMGDGDACLVPLGVNNRGGGDIDNDNDGKGGGEADASPLLGVEYMLLEL